MIKQFRKIKNFLAGILTEIRQVTWTSYRDVRKLSVIILIFLIAGIFFILILDQAFVIIRNLILTR